MEIKNETVYVVYRNEEPYSESNHKTVYTKRSSANGVITSICKSLANSILHWSSSEEDRKAIVEKYKKEFKIVEYKPVK